MKKLLSVLLYSFLLTISSISLAEEQSAFNWQFGIGLGISHNRNLLPTMDSPRNGIPQLQLLFDFEYKNWFAETPSLRSGQLFGVRSGRLLDDFTLGYRLSNSERQNLAVIVASYHDGFGPSIASGDGIRNSKLAGLHNRKSDLMPGLRYQLYTTDNQLLSLQLNKSVSAHHGEMLRLFYGFRFEQHNWDLYFNSELSWYSAKLVNYYYGVTAAEVRSQRPRYQSGSGWRWHNGLVGVYPLNQHWVTELGAGINWYTQAFTDSPLTRNNPEVVSFALIRYVF